MFEVADLTRLLSGWKGSWGKKKKPPTKKTLPILEPAPIWTGMYKDIINLDESFVFANISFTWLQIRRSFKKDL